MAITSALGLAMLCVTFFMSPVMVNSNSLKEIGLYVTIITSGPNANTVLVAGPGPGPATNDTAFGAVNVFDGILRETANKLSPVVGRVQGIQVVSSKNGNRLYYSLSIIIERGKYKVGTLQAQGNLKVVTSGIGAGQLGLTSGTMAYRSVNGYVDVQSVPQVPAPNTIIFLLKIFYKDIDD